MSLISSPFGNVISNVFSSYSYNAVDGIIYGFGCIIRPSEAEKIKQMLDPVSRLVSTEIFFVFLGIALRNEEIYRAAPFAFYSDKLSGKVFLLSLLMHSSSKSGAEEDTG